MADSQFYVIIVAGGSGKRMNSTVPKQFLPVNDKPILMHTIEKFHTSRYRPEIILVLSKDSRDLWETMLKEYSFDVPHYVVDGGTERFHSVKNGIEKISALTDNSKNIVIAVHDAVRPLVSAKTIDNCYKNALLNGNAVASVNSKDSVRILKSENENASVPRDTVYLIQTPQTFTYQQLTDAYQQSYNKNFTDDASVVEKAGYKIYLEEGDHFNIKITYPEDIVLAQTLLNTKE